MQDHAWSRCPLYCISEKNLEINNLVKTNLRQVAQFEYLCEEWRIDINGDSCRIVSPTSISSLATTYLPFKEPVIMYIYCTYASSELQELLGNQLLTSDKKCQIVYLCNLIVDLYYFKLWINQINKYWKNQWLVNFFKMCVRFLQILKASNLWLATLNKNQTYVCT